MADSIQSKSNFTPGPWNVDGINLSAPVNGHCMAIWGGGRYHPEFDLNPMPFTNYLWNTKLDNGSQRSSCKAATESFKTLWQSINGPESWEANPWVWVVKFKVLSTTGKPV